MDETPEEAEWRRWVADHAAGFLLFARQRARCEADAQDLVQEALVESAHRQGDGRPPPRALVFATIRRRAMDMARGEDRRLGREQAVFDAPEAWFDSGVEDRELARLVQTAINRLPDIYREVITLKMWGGLTFAQIAETLAIPANTAASRYRYGLAELRKVAKEVLA
jgi:RNA polymerase sigma-70 factor (ECF subfamily)